MKALSKKTLIISLLVLLPILTYSQASTPSFTKLGKSITKRQTSDIEKARAIYDWVCDNIAYDTTHTIYTSTECLNSLTGTHLAYCELYGALCKTVGIECNIIYGIAKDIYGNFDNNEHSWISLQIDKDTLLIDPTWGAKGTNASQPMLSNHRDLWFDIDPYYLIFSHFPNDSIHQCIETPIDFRIFDQLPPFSPDCQYLGWKAKDLLEQCLTKEIQTIPYIFAIEKNKSLQISHAPMTRILTIDSTYTFAIQNPQGHAFGIRMNDSIIDSKHWSHSDQTYSLSITPKKEGTLSIQIIEADGQTHNLIQYLVSEVYPTDQETDDDQQAAPITYDLDFESVIPIDMPQYRYLNPAQTYHFEIANPRDIAFAIAVNNVWYTSSQWEKTDSIYSLDLMPASGGVLQLLVHHMNNQFYPLIEYRISQPTQQEAEYIKQHLPPITYNLEIETITIPKKPKYRNINPAQSYEFVVENPDSISFAIVVNNTWYYSTQWQKENHLYSINIMPAEAGVLKVMVQKPDGQYYPLVQYEVSEPTEQELAYIYANRPPTIYHLDTETIQLMDIPKKKLLNPATTYHFEVGNPNQIPFAITMNNHWFYANQWKKVGTRYSIDIFPAEGGTLRIMMQKPNQQFYPLAEYSVTEPTEAEKQVITAYQQPVIHKGFDSLQLTQIPQYRNLNPAVTYHFEIDNPQDWPFAIVVNNTWYYSKLWKKTGTQYTFDLMPAEGGNLKIMVQKPNQGYYPYVEYHVSEPTEQEIEYIETHRPPTLFNVNFESVQLIDIPKYRLLNPATIYHFEIKNPQHLSFALSINNKWYYESQWQKLGDIYSLDILPSEGGELKLLVKNPNQRYTAVAEYQVTTPTEQEEAFILTHKPPVIKKLNFESIRLVEIPPFNQLNPATTYHFEVDNPLGFTFVIVVNNTQYHMHQWTQSGNKYTFDLIPAEGGVLKLMVLKPGEGYYTLVEYQVSAPTEEELIYIASHRPPIVYQLDFETIQLKDIPKYGQLNPATIYRFEVINPNHLSFAAIVNKTWYRMEQWQNDGDLYWIDILPGEGGTLKLSVAEANKQYYTFVEYTITTPTKEESKQIKSKKKHLASH